MKFTCLLFALVTTLILACNSLAQQIPVDDQLDEFTLPVEEQRKIKTVAIPKVMDSVPKAMMSSLVNVFNQLTVTQKRELGPLTKKERLELEDEENPVELREKIGIVRSLQPSLKITNLKRTAIGNKSTDTFAGGRLDIADDGRLIYTVEISSADATGIRIEIQNIDLPQDAKIFVTDGNRQVEGPYVFSGRNNSPFWTNTIFNSKVYVQVQVPANAVNRANAFSIINIAHLEVNSGRTPSPTSKDNVSEQEEINLVECELISNCRLNPLPTNPTSEQTLFETASLGVAHINYKVGNGFYICSGGLLSDRAGSNTPFFLTANHCFSSPSSARSLEAFFRYRRVCGQPVPSLATLPKTLGSTLLATSSQTDFTLVQLSQNPPANSHFFRWTTEDVSNSTTTIYRVHHPKGYSQHLQRSTVRQLGGCSSLPRGRYIYSNPQRGETRGGSSGSLIFRANGNTLEIVGQLYGSCSDEDQACGYANVDGSFARTFPKICKFLETNPSACPSEP